MRVLGVALLIALAAAAPIEAQPAPPPRAAVSPLIAQRAHDLIALINGGGDATALFAPSFLAQVPESKVREIAAQLVAQLGKATGVGAFTPISPFASTLQTRFETGEATLNLTVMSEPPGQITGLWITNVQSAALARLTTLASVADAIRALPGETGFIAATINHPDAPLASANPDHPLAIGSTFKLVILAELVRAINAGERHWDDEIVLDGTERPAGAFMHTPAGTPVALRTLAEDMIKVSDNSATDVLIHTLGRERIEAMQTQVGLRQAAANRPFLTTMEAFKLKGVGQGALGRRYLATDEPGRRALLAGEVAAVPASAIGALFADGQPVMIDRLEWFASPADLVRVMMWLYRQRTTPGGAEALRILAINPGPATALVSQFGYIGYKGGSEPGVLSMTLLLRDKRGAATVISASWNNSQAPVDELRFSSLIRHTAELIIAPAP